MGRMDGEGLVHDEKKGVTPFPKNEEKREGKSKKERALKKFSNRERFSREK